MSNFIIYKIKNFKISKKGFSKFKVEGNLDYITSKLKKNRGYCLRIDPTKPCIVYGDLDHIPIYNANTITQFLNLVSTRFDKKQFTE